MLNSTEHEITNTQKNLYAEKESFLAFKLSDVVFIIIINLKNDNNCCHFKMYALYKFHAHFSEHEQCFITSMPGLDKQLYNVRNLQQDIHDVLLLQIV